MCLKRTAERRSSPISSSFSMRRRFEPTMGVLPQADGMKLRKQTDAAHLTARTCRSIHYFHLFSRKSLGKSISTGVPPSRIRQKLMNADAPSPAFTALQWAQKLRMSYLYSRTSRIQANHSRCPQSEPFWIILMGPNWGQYGLGSMYAIYGTIYHQYTPNVSIYTIHGSYGIWFRMVYVPLNFGIVHIWKLRESDSIILY